MGLQSAATIKFLFRVACFETARASPCAAQQTGAGHEKSRPGATPDGFLMRLPARHLRFRRIWVQC
jgi:hypothetical protein